MTARSVSPPGLCAGQPFGALFAWPGTTSQASQSEHIQKGLQHAQLLLCMLYFKQGQQFALFHSMMQYWRCIVVAMSVQIPSMCCYNLLLWSCCSWCGETVLFQLFTDSVHPPLHACGGVRYAGHVHHAYSGTAVQMRSSVAPYSAPVRDDKPIEGPTDCSALNGRLSSVTSLCDAASERDKSLTCMRETHHLVSYLQLKPYHTI